MPNRKRVANGIPRKFFDEAIKIESNNCIEWPYYGNKGYGYLTLDGKLTFVHRLALLIKVGEPPTTKHQALHSCHNPPCFNYKHLRWGTNLENSHDRSKDGTQQRGEKVHNAKLNSREVVTIKSLLESMSNKELGIRFNVKPSTINAIRVGRSWKHV